MPPAKTPWAAINVLASRDSRETEKRVSVCNNPPVVIKFDMQILFSVYLQWFDFIFVSAFIICKIVVTWSLGTV